MSIKPILFNTDMVRAILDGRKTVTRRVVKPQPDKKHQSPLGYVVRGLGQYREGCFGFGIDEYGGNVQHAKPQYQPDDILYVRETWHKYIKRVGKGEGCHLAEFYGYKASVKNSEDSNAPWKPSIHMPKEVARIWLKVTNVRVERLQDMSHDDAGKEGIHYCECPDGFTWKTDADMKCCYLTPSGAFKALWNSTVEKADIDRYGWESNPWVWVIEFERCEKPQEGEI